MKSRELHQNQFSCLCRFQEIFMHQKRKDTLTNIFIEFNFNLKWHTRKQLHGILSSSNGIVASKLILLLYQIPGNFAIIIKNLFNMVINTSVIMEFTWIVENLSSFKINKNL